MFFHLVELAVVDPPLLLKLLDLFLELVLSQISDVFFAVEFEHLLLQCLYLVFLLLQLLLAVPPHLVQFLVQLKQLVRHLLLLLLHLLQLALLLVQLLSGRLMS